jgi:hypothetical protein
MRNIRFRLLAFPMFFLALSACSPSGAEVTRQLETPIVTKSLTGQGVILSDKAPLRSIPDFDGQLLGTLSRGTQVVVLAVTDDEQWYFVRTVDFGEGWVFDVFIQIESPATTPGTETTMPPYLAPTIFIPAYPPYPALVTTTPASTSTPSFVVTTTPASTSTPSLIVTQLPRPTNTPCVGYDCFFPPPFPSFAAITRTIGWTGFGLIMGWLLVLFDGPRWLQRLRKRK